MALKPPPMPRLRVGFRILSGWTLHRGPPLTWAIWIGENAARSLPIYVPHNASQADVDKHAFNACRRIDEAAGRPVKK